MNDAYEQFQAQNGERAGWFEEKPLPLALHCLEESRSKGFSIEIPSIGVTIESDANPSVDPGDE